MQNLPIGIQSFEYLRTNINNYLYVDKTQFIHKMTTIGKVYFLSRPRRFGKSLLVSTMKELFEGNKDLFKGLFIYDKWNWDIKYPVLRLDFGARLYETPDILKKSLTNFVKSQARDFNIQLETDTLSDMFEELIKALHKTTKQQVVVLIDEYDKPMTDFLSDIEKAAVNKQILHDFYQVLKAADDHIQFIFLTGVSKLSGVSVFSALNNPKDISLSEDFAAICGYTQIELEQYFDEYIDEAAKRFNESKQEMIDDIRFWYNGYTWDGKTSVYNPFSTLNFFAEKEFANYWIETGSSISTIQLLKNEDLLKALFEPISVNRKFFKGFDLTNIGGMSFMFQSGYLTIKDKQIVEKEAKYQLEVPNHEVKDSISQHLLSTYTKLEDYQLEEIAKSIHSQIKNSDAQGLEQSLKTLFAQIPYILHLTVESYYHSMYLLMLLCFGFKVQGERITNLGRIDAALELEKLTAIVEIKYSAEKSKENLLDEAIQQIRDKKYYEAYLNKPVILLAIA
ncbi:MAG: ATP-binding protein, partial [Elusimicrobiota bacterium]|nr:ATP-binding protein [Elusimicrobiota bacterium]